MDKPDKLYKYCDQGGLNILETNEIKVSHFFDFNDPFEMNPVFDKKELREYFRICRKRIPKKIRKTIPESENKSSKKIFIGDFHKSLRERANESTYVLCFSTIPDNLLMWAHYAKQHKGIVIEFDKEHDFFQEHLGEQNNTQLFRKVNYKDKNRPLCSVKSILNQTQNGISDFIQKNFFTKSKDWEYEKEWRMTFPLINKNIREETHPNNNKRFLLKFPPDCISGVILGCRACETENEQESFTYKLRKIIEKRRPYYSPNFKTQKAVLDESEYKLNIVNWPNE